MTTQVLMLSGLGGEGWSGAVLVDPALVDGGASAYLRSIRRRGTSVQIRLSATAGGHAQDAGPAFTGALEGAESAFTFAAGGARVTLKGPGHADNTRRDATEPYVWTPDNIAAMRAWFESVRGDFTLTLDDGLTAPAIRGTAVAGGAAARARVAVLPALALADFDAEGLEVDALALIRAGAGDTIYAAPPRGTVGALLDGELGLGADEAPITRIRRVGDAMLLINDNAPLALRDYFSSGGAGATLSLYIQTRAGVASLPATTRNAGGNYVNFGPLDATLRAIVDSIAEGDRFIVAFARRAHAVVAVRGAAVAAGTEASARVLRVTPAIRALRGSAAAGDPRAAARLALGHVRALRGAAAAGPARVTARLALGHVRALRGTAAAGPSEAEAHIVRVLPPGLRYARSLRASAPAERLITALEISHPAVAVPVRVVNDTAGHTIEGNDYVALRFDARLADDIDGQTPQAELGIDNVGRELTQWIEAAQGGVGATVRVMLVLDIEDPPVEWEVTLDVASMAVDQERVTARLGFDPLLGRAAVALRHDPQTSPGLF